MHDTWSRMTKVLYAHEPEKCVHGMDILGTEWQPAGLLNRYAHMSTPMANRHTCTQKMSISITPNRGISALTPETQVPVAQNQVVFLVRGVPAEVTGLTTVKAAARSTI